MTSNRKRGAQPGNTNAVKHGFYSRALDRVGQQYLSEARELEPNSMAEEIDVFRVRLLQLLAVDKDGQLDPERLALTATVANALARMIATHFHMGGSAQDRLVSSVNNILDDIRHIMGEEVKP